MPPIYHLSLNILLRKGNFNRTKFEAIVVSPKMPRCHAKPDDSTYFRHIDMNIPEFLTTGRGGSIIQGSVSLNDESTETGCTELVPGMHLNLGDWWSDVTARTEPSHRKGYTGRVSRALRHLCLLFMCLRAFRVVGTRLPGIPCNS